MRHFGWQPGQRRGWLSLLALLFLFATLNGGHCHWVYVDDDGCDDDDDGDDDNFDDDVYCDDDFDDDDFSVSNGTNARLADYRLQQFRVVPSEDPTRHPIAGLVDIERASLSAMFGPARYTSSDLRLFADRVLTANEDLIGLPAEAGVLQFRTVQFSSSCIAVIYDQLRAGAPGTPVDGAGLQMWFDVLGSLRQISNSTLLADVATPPAADLETAADSGK